MFTVALVFVAFLIVILGCLRPTVILFITVYVCTVTLCCRKCRDKLGKHIPCCCACFCPLRYFWISENGSHFPPVPSFVHASLDLGYRIGHPARHHQLQRQSKCDRLPLVVFSEGLSPKCPWARADTDILSSSTFEDRCFRRVSHRQLHHGHLEVTVEDDWVVW
jgi:hypothetical protein